MTANITKTTENYRGGKENKEISKKETCSYMVSDLAYSARSCVEQLHLLIDQLLNVGFVLCCKGGQYQLILRLSWALTILKLDTYNSESMNHNNKHLTFSFLLFAFLSEILILG
jgi:hypothetical protein